MKKEVHRVLLVGYGTIGTMKAPLYAMLGYAVFVLDLDSRRQNLAVANGYCLHNNSIDLSSYAVIDVCTPSGTHIAVLRELLRDYKKSVDFIIIIEKPLYSSYEEKNELVQMSTNENLLNQVRVNEQYYFSSVFRNFNATLSGQPMHIKIEMSKNRLYEAQKKERFWDNKLEGFGIEFPHIIALLDILGIDFTLIKWSKKVKYIRGSDKRNQGIALVGTYGSQVISLLSYLGDFYFDGDKLVKNLETRRYITLTYEEGNEQTIRFDPVHGFPRYHSIIQTDNHFSIQEDNMLLASLSSFLFCRNYERTLSEKCGIKNAIRLSDYLIAVSCNCATQLI